MFKKLCFAVFAFVFSVNIIAADADINLQVNKETVSVENISTDTEEVQAPKEPEYRAYLLGDSEGNIYYSENENEKVPMASVTKIMTLMLTYDALDEGKIKLADKMTVDKVMAKMEGSRIWMKEGSQISVEDLIKATALHSANNAAYGLAKFVGGDIDTFVNMMNEKAEKLGFGDEIEYHTPTGLPPHMTGRGEDVGSALGIYKLSLAALKYPEYIKMASKTEDKVAYLGNRKIYNRNKLLGKDGIYGIKTGHHDNWFNITVASDKNGINTVTVVLGAPTEEMRNEKILEEIELFHDEYKLVEFLNEKIPVSEIDVSNGVVKKLELYPDKDFKGIAGNDSKVRFVIYKKRLITAPLKAGEDVGSYELYIDGRLADSGNLLVKEDVDSMSSLFE